jgi:molybdopterin-guanine dinucleotide biosynthesis protein A
VLAGGRSSRVGGNKALLPLRGEPLIRSVVRAVETVAGGAVPVGNETLYGHLGFHAMPDLHPGEGPMRAIVTALGSLLSPAGPFEGGERRAMAVFDLLKAGVIRFQEAAYFQNVNTPEGWALYAAERS